MEGKNDSIPSQSDGIEEVVDIIEEAKKAGQGGLESEYVKYLREKVDLLSHENELLKDYFRERADSRASEEKEKLENERQKKEKERIEKRRMMIFAFALSLMTISFIAWYGPQKITREEVGLLSLILSTTVAFGASVTVVLDKFQSLRFTDIGNKFRSKKVLDPSEAWPFPSGYDEESKARVDPFVKSFQRMQSEMIRKAERATDTAELLLEKGTTYTKWGIFFFLASIAFWQFMTNYYFHEFKPQHIYGIISCSALFIFIEAISAWFLRQYRHYVDTATYLLKVKALFDRYLLLYHAVDAHSSHDNGSKERAEILLNSLSEAIKWPESYILKSPDRTHLQDATEAMTVLLKEVKELRGKEDNRKSEKKDG